MNTLRAFFSWPNGGVWANEVANILWVPIGAVAGWFIKRRSDRRHQELMHHVSKIHTHLGIEKD